MGIVCPHLPLGTKALLRSVEQPFSDGSVVVDSNNNVYIFSLFGSRIQKYEEKGSFLFGWYASQGILNNVRLSLVIDENDFLYIYSSKKLEKYDQDGNLLDLIQKSNPNEWWVMGEKGVEFIKQGAYKENSVSWHTIVKKGEAFPPLPDTSKRFRTPDRGFYTLEERFRFFRVLKVEAKQKSMVIKPNVFSLPFSFPLPIIPLFFVVFFTMAAIENASGKKPSKTKSL